MSHVWFAMVSNAYIATAATATKKQMVDEHSIDVAKELVKYGADKLLKQYKGTKIRTSPNSHDAVYSNT
jgi:hypothetical protein